MSEIKWTASRIDVANYCRMRYWLKYVEHVEDSRLTAFAKGSVFHEAFEHFWTKLGSVEDLVDVRKNKRGEINKYFYRGNKIKYHDSESFGCFVMGSWNQVVVRDNILREKLESGKLHGSEIKSAKSCLIDWTTKTEKYEAAYQLRDASTLVFDILNEEGPPIANELKFDFVLRDLYFSDNEKNKFNMWFSGRLDELRLRDGKVVIRDYKSGKPWIDAQKIKHDPQLTFYNAGLCSVVLKNEKLADELGLTERRKDYFKEGHFIDENFVMEFFMVEAPIASKRIIEKNPDVDKKRLPKILHETYRNDAHFFELMRMIKGTESSMVDGNVYPERGRKCDFCNVKEACENKLEDSMRENPVLDNGQGIFDFAAATYDKKFVADSGKKVISSSGEESLEREVVIKKNQKKFNYNRKTSY